MPEVWHLSLLLLSFLLSFCLYKSPLCQLREGELRRDCLFLSEHSLTFPAAPAYKGVSQHCNSFHCFLIFDSKTHENHWQLYRCVNAITSATSIPNPEKLLQRPNGSLSILPDMQLLDPAIFCCQTSQLLPDPVGELQRRTHLLFPIIKALRIKPPSK